MRIGAGSFGGRVLKTPRGEATRPTSGLVRATLFNILTPMLPGARVLDLFAGCGSVGLEALSRGAAHATLVENARPALACLRENVTALGVTAQVEMLPLPVARALDALAASGATFDIIFLDPPFADTAAYQSVFTTIAASTLLSPDGILIAQHDARAALAETVGKLSRFRVKTMGDNALSFYRDA